MLIFVEKYGILNAHQNLRRGYMREAMTVFGVVAVIWIFVMMMRCPDAKENFSKEHRKSLMLAIIPMIVFIILVALLMSHVGL